MISLIVKAYLIIFFQGYHGLRCQLHEEMHDRMRVRVLLALSLALAGLTAGTAVHAAAVNARAPGSETGETQTSSAPDVFLAPLNLTDGRVYGTRGPVLPSETSASSVRWDFTKWLGLDLTAARGDERNGLLGKFEPGVLPSQRSARAAAVGLSARFGFGAGWVTSFSYNEGIAQLNLRPSGLLGDGDTLHSRAYGIAVAKHGLFSGDDSFGLTVSRPLELYNGGASLPAAASGRDALIGSDRNLLLGGTKETDVELGYVTTFFDGALALQANAGYQMNLAGQRGQNSVTVLSRAKINF